jgi:DNA polymerase-3 subunit alpha
MSAATDLHVHSMFSPYDGMGSPKAVVDRAVELGWGAVALTEHGWLGSAAALYKAAKVAKIKPIIGCELYVTPHESLIDGDKDVMRNTRHLTVLALSYEGYVNLVHWVNASMERPAYYGRPRISLDRMADIAPHGMHHNVVLSGCMGGELCQCLLHGNGNAQVGAELYISSCQALFPNFYIELQNHAIPKFMGIEGLGNYHKMCTDQAAVRKRLLGLAQELAVPVIVTNDSHFQTQDQRKPHIAMLARKANAAKRETSADFTDQYAYWTNYMRPIEKIAATLPSWAEKEGIESIHAIVSEVDIRLDPLDKFSYTLPKSAYRDPVAEVRRRSKSRLKSMVARYGELAQERFDYELGAMEEFADYLLIYSDIVRMARSQGIYTWTRGSAANSLVNYCLKIHEIDPIHYRLMFERFVNPARAKFPDVDIDIESHRQPDVARMIVEYMTEIEGPDNVLPICTYSTTSNRNAFRMMAEAAGVPKERIDELAKLLPQMIDSGMVTDEEEAYETLREELGMDIHADASAVFDSIGGVSQHACAFVLGTRERPLTDWVPRYRIGSSDTVVTQYNMKWIEELGFLKLDLLKLDTLTILHSIARMLGKDIDWLDKVAQSAPGIYAIEDDITFEMLRAGRTDGIHSMQGGSQRRGCIEVGVESDADLVAIQALYRPSGTRTGLDKKFVERKHERDEWASINEFVGGYLDETFGIAIYQEQIMDMGFGLGMSGEEVDDLYKAIKTAKGVGRGAKELFEAFEPTFRKYADAQMPKEEADELWAEWEKLQGYTFNRGHASSYAILALKTAWLKAHYPQEFFVALLERYPDNPRYLAAAIAEGFRFEPPDVNTSAGGFGRGSDDKSIRVGLLRIAGLGPGAVSEIVRNQPFASVDDLRERTNGQRVKAPTIEALGTVGALETLGVAGDKDDDAQFQLLNFVLGKPKAFKGIKVKLDRKQGGRNWKFLGMQHGVEITEGKTFCAKLFWIPENASFSTKTSATGAYNAHLLTVVDENGIPFDLRVSESKDAESDLIKTLAKHAQGAVICAEGKVVMPFVRGANTGFQLWGVSGAEQDNPLIWHSTEKVAKSIMRFARNKRAQQRR